MGMEVYFHAILTTAPGGGERSLSRLGRFNLRERPSGIHWMRFGGPESRFGRGGEVKKTLPLPGIELRSSSLYPSYYTN
jgi:hypothetical protein